MWFYLDFDHPSKDITEVAIVMPSFIMDNIVHSTMQFRGPAEN